MDPEVVEAVTIAAAAVAGGVSTLAAKVAVAKRKGKKAQKKDSPPHEAKATCEPVVGYSKRALKRSSK